MTNERDLEIADNLGPTIADRLKEKHGFTEEEITQLEEAFTVFDRDQDGLISCGELGSVMMAIGHTPTMPELEMLIKGIDIKKTGAVDFDEFLCMMSKKMGFNPAAEVEEVFSVFDINQDGVITADELYTILTRLGESVTKEDAEGMIKEADTNGDGVVDMIEFKGILHAK